LRFFIDPKIAFPPTLPTPICVTATTGLARSVDLLPFWKRLATQPFTHLPAIFEYEPVDIAIDRSVHITDDPFHTSIAVILLVAEVATSWNRLLVLPESTRARLSTPTDGTSHIVNSRYAAPFTDTTFDTL